MGDGGVDGGVDGLATALPGGWVEEEGSECDFDGGVLVLDSGNGVSGLGDGEDDEDVCRRRGAAATHCDTLGEQGGSQTCESTGSYGDGSYI